MYGQQSTTNYILILMPVDRNPGSICPPVVMVLMDVPFVAMAPTKIHGLPNLIYHRPTHITGMIMGLHPANERRRYFVTTSLIGWTQA